MRIIELFHFLWFASDWLVCSGDFRPFVWLQSRQNVRPSTQESDAWSQPKAEHCLLLKCFRMKIKTVTRRPRRIFRPKGLELEWRPALCSTDSFGSSLAEYWLILLITFHTGVFLNKEADRWTDGQQRKGSFPICPLPLSCGTHGLSLFQTGFPP